MVKKPTIY